MFPSKLTIAECLKDSSHKLQKISPTPWLEAEILLGFSLNTNKEYLITHPDEIVTLKAKGLFNRLLQQRLNHIPLAYLTQEKEFYGRKFYINSNVLIPRPETEILIDQAKFFLSQFKKAAPKILEIGTGSGCISITLALEAQQRVEIIATDYSTKALSIAKHNCQELLKHTNRKIKLVKHDFLRQKLTEGYDLIISNPPYIPEAELSGLSKEVKKEPTKALVGGKDGLVFYRKFKKVLPQQLRPNGLAILEIHSLNKAAMIDLFQDRFNYSVIADYAQKSRALVLRLK